MPSQIRINPVKQLTKVDCVPACGVMIANFLQKQIDYDHLISILPRTKNGGVNFFVFIDLLSKLLKVKFHIMFFNYFYFSDGFSALSRSEQAGYLENLQSAKDVDEQNISALMKCVKNENIILHHNFFGTKDIEAQLNKNNPVIASVVIKDFRKTRFPSFATHGIIINGFDSDNFAYVDPHWDDTKFGQREVKKEHLYACIVKKTFPAFAWAEA